MPEMDGFDVVERVGPEQIQAIIFVTAFDQYALKAFDVHALDYLLKPFDDERFGNALRRAKSQIEAREINRLSKRLLAYWWESLGVSVALPRQLADLPC